MKTNHSVFKPVSMNTLKLMASMNKNKEPTFVIPTRFVSKESAKVGCLFNELCNLMVGKKGKNFKSFFCSSSDEARQGAIKIIRHYGYNRFNKHQGKIVICANDSNTSPLFDLELDGRKLYPNIVCIKTIQDTLHSIRNNSWLGIIFVIKQISEIEEINSFLRQRHDRHLIIGLDLSLLPISKLHGLNSKIKNIDVFIWGENLTNREIPFGAFTMTNKIYTPWNTISHCVLHSSTYGGNTLSLKKVLAEVISRYGMANKFEDKIQNAVASNKERYKSFASYVNPKLSVIYKISGHHFDVIRADNCYLTIEEHSKQYEVFDCVGGGGLSVFGHNPSDLEEAVLQKHSYKTDYVNLLAEKLYQLTGYPHFFPAVSGATAVETAIILALMSQPKSKQKIIVFKQNYSGKLLLPLVVTQLEQSNTSQLFFQPLYDNIVILDPFCLNALKLLELFIESGEVGLIWFEYIRGQDGKKIPEEIINTIKMKQETYGYYVGVDEILTGLCRTGPFLSIETTKLQPDIVTLSKGLTYMTFPIGGTLTKGTVLKNIDVEHRDAVQFLQRRYRNHIGAHIALHCLERIEKEYVSENVISYSAKLDDQIRKTDHHKQIQSVRQYGLYFSIVLKEPWWLKICCLSKILRTIWAFRIMKKWMQEAQLFSFFGSRMLPKLALTEEEYNDLLRRVNKILKSK